MKRIFDILFALLLVACLGLLTQAPDRTGGPAYAAGAQPMALAGIASTITPAGPVPAGTLVQAYVGTELRAETTTEAEGLYRNLLVLGPGGTVTFRVAGVLAQESITWESGEIMDDFDLTIPALPSAGYSLTMAVSPVVAGTATDVTNSPPYAAGVTVSIKGVAATGYHFSHWTAAPAVVFGNANVAETTFTMPAQDVTVTANFAVAGPTTWYVVEGGAGAQDGINWDDAFATIQEAIDAASAGDTIMVAAGEYDAFQVIEKTNISIITTEGATVTTAASFSIDVGPIGDAWTMAAVYEAQNINIEGINFDGAGVSAKEVFVGIAYVDSTGTIARLTVGNVIATELGAGVAIIGDVGTSTVEITGAVISNNDDTGIYVCGGSTLEAHFNNIVGNTWLGVLNDGGQSVDATYNWWGHASGPYHSVGNPGGTGNAVSDNVDFNPWLRADVGPVKTETVKEDILDAKAEADTVVAVRGTATVTVAKYTGNPQDGPPTEAKSLEKYIDVYVPDIDQVTEIEIRIYYYDHEVFEDQELLQIFWWDGNKWEACSYIGVDTASTNGYSGYAWARINANTQPSLTDLIGTEMDLREGPRTPPCAIATAAYGTDTAKEIAILREFRDTVLLPTDLGAAFVALYHRTSPPIANFISRHEILRTAVRMGLVDPIVAVLEWSQDLWLARGSPG